MTECLRRPYSQASAEYMAAVHGRSVFRCQWDGDWHVGTDPGPVAPCWRCGVLVTIPPHGTPADAARGWLHDERRCGAPVPA